MTAPNYRYSASQVSTFRDCRRKWAFKTIDKIEAPPNKYAEMGSRIHKKLETYLTTGLLGDPLTDDDFKIILPGIKYLPRVGTATVEEYIKIPTDYGPFIGYIDAQFTDDQGRHVNIDHKTTSALKWALTPEKLKSDTQSVAYAKYALDKTGADSVVNRWVYYQRNAKRPKAQKVEVEMSLSHVDKQWLTILDDVREMKQLRDSGVKAIQVEKNLNICNKYGGCPYKENCQLTPAERLRSYTMQASMMERMKAHQKKKQEAAKVEPPAINPPEEKLVEPSAETAAKAGPLETLKGKKTPAKKKAAKKAPTKKKEYVKPEIKEGYRLFVDCVPSTPATDFTTLLSQAQALVGEEHNVPHYRLIPDQFGGYGAVLQQYLDIVLREETPAAIVISSRMPEAQDALATLRANAIEVVQGMA